LPDATHVLDWDHLTRRLTVSRRRANCDLIRRVCRQPDHWSADVQVAADALVSRVCCQWINPAKAGL